MTKSNLPEAHAWIDANLELFIQKSIPVGIKPHSSQLPHQLNKSVYLVSSQSYANALKKRFSLFSTTTTQPTANN